MAMTVPIQIANPDVVRDIHLLAELTGRPITDVVAEAVRAKLWETTGARERLEELHKRVAALPRIGPLLADADIYDEDGIPR